MATKGEFNENTRVQVPAAIHLCKLGYTYLSAISDDDLDPETNILTKVMFDSMKRLNREHRGLVLVSMGNVLKCLQIHVKLSKSYR